MHAIVILSLFCEESKDSKLKASSLVPQDEKLTLSF